MTLLFLWQYISVVEWLWYFCADRQFDMCVQISLVLVSNRIRFRMSLYVSIIFSPSSFKAAWAALVMAAVWETVTFRKQPYRKWIVPKDKTRTQPKTQHLKYYFQNWHSRSICTPLYGIPSKVFPYSITVTYIVYIYLYLVLDLAEYKWFLWIFHLCTLQNNIIYIYRLVGAN